MSKPDRLMTLAVKPIYQVVAVAGLSILLTLFDALFPVNNDFLKVNAGPWIVTTAMVLLFIIVNTIVVLRVQDLLPYWIQSVVCFMALLVFSYGWSWMISGKHIDEVGSFRWIWMVLFMVYLVFFVIARSMKTIVDFAIRQDNKLRGEE